MESDRERKIYGHTPLMAGCSLRLHRRAQRRVLRMRARAQRRQPRRHRRQHPPLDGGGGDARVSIKSICVEYTNNTTRTDGAQYFGRGAQAARLSRETPHETPEHALTQTGTKNSGMETDEQRPGGAPTGWLGAFFLRSIGPIFLSEPAAGDHRRALCSCACGRCSGDRDGDLHVVATAVVAVAARVLLVAEGAVAVEPAAIPGASRGTTREHTADRLGRWRSRALF